MFLLAALHIECSQKHFDLVFYLLISPYSHSPSIASNGFQSPAQNCSIIVRILSVFFFTLCHCVQHKKISKMNFSYVYD